MKSNLKVLCTLLLSSLLGNTSDLYARHQGAPCASGGHGMVCFFFFYCSLQSFISEKYLKELN